MNKLIIRFRVVSAILILITGIATAEEVTDYQLQDLDGRIHKVSDLKGKWLVINFWATWCPPCIKEMPELESFYQNHRDTAMVWGVTFELTEASNIKSFIEKLEVSYPILGRAQSPKTGFGEVRVLPTTFIIDREGQFLHRFEGPIVEQDILDIIDGQ